MNNYHLLITPRSPFARRVRIAMHRLGIPFDVEPVDIFNPDEKFLLTNPLAMVPVLIVKDAQIELPDSSTILEHLHENHGGRIWPADPRERLRARQLSTMAEGIMSYSVANFLENQRKAPLAEASEEYVGNIHRTLARLMDRTQEIRGAIQSLLDVATALEYLDLRLPSLDWRGRYAALKGILEEAQRLPEFKQTNPPPA